MKILIICKALEQSFAGGIQTHVSSITEELASEGHELTILTAGNSGFVAQPSYPGIRVINLAYIPKKFAFGLGNFLGELSFNLMVNKWLKNHQSKFDLVHVQGRSGMMLTKKIVDRPIITTVHRLMSVEKQWNACDYRNPIDRILHLGLCDKYEKSILKNSDSIIAVSESTKKEIERFEGSCSERIAVVPNGVAIPEMDKITKENKLLFVGRLTEVKGISILIESMKFTDPGIKLDIVGSGPQKEDLIKLIHNIGLEDRVKLLGSKPRHEVYQLMNQSKALVLPSFHESQGIVMLEANAHELPVIASQSSGISEYIINGVNGYLFEKGEPRALANRINMIFSQPRVARMIGKSGRIKMINNYRWNAIAKTTINIYKSVA